MRQGWPFCALHGSEFLIGWPDYHFVIPMQSKVGDWVECGRAGYIEMKRENKDPSPLQLAIQERLRRAGAFVVGACTSWQMVADALHNEGVEVR
jgi:hypothetical protein